jgi:UDP-N-acetylmuramate--alanine ligase
MGRELGAADVVVVTDVFAAREDPMPGVNGRIVAESGQRSNRAVSYEPDRGRLAGRVRELLRPGDVLLTLGAGDITRLGREIIPLLGSDR